MKLIKETINAIEYNCSYVDFSKETYTDGTPRYNWSEAWWTLINGFNSSRADMLDLRIRQGGREPDGFYPNVVHLVIDPKKTPMYWKSNWDEFLTSLGYGYSKNEIPVVLAHVEYEDKDLDEDYFPEVIVDYD